jgi:glycosyltransferase involved in cell wall biosynthesis
MFSIQGFFRTDIRILNELGYRVKLANHFWRYLCYSQYDIAYIYFYRYGLIPAVISKIMKKKVIFTGGIDYLDRSFAGKRAYIIQKIFFKLCGYFSDRSIIVSNQDLENIRKAYKKQPRNLIVSNHSIDISNYESSISLYKENLITTVAWMVNEDNTIRKGVHRCIEVFRELSRISPEYRLNIIGPKGPGSIYVESLVRKYGLQSKIIFTGAISEKEKISILNKSKLYLQLSDYEGFGISAVEAMMAGNLVVHSGKGGLVDGLGNNGIVVPDHNNYIEIASLLFDIIQNINKPEYQAKIEEGRIYIKSKFSINRRRSDIRLEMDNLD